jgi:hypothetical protein
LQVSAVKYWLKRHTTACKFYFLEGKNLSDKSYSLPAKAGFLVAFYGYFIIFKQILKQKSCKVRSTKRAAAKPGLPVQQRLPFALFYEDFYSFQYFSYF